jgi:hypothetical protein
MLLANVVLMAQIAGSSPARQVTRPCADVSALCRISPFFCPGTYPQGMEPCWPDGTRQPRSVGPRGSGSHGSRPQAAPVAAPDRTLPSRARESESPRSTRVVTRAAD